MSFRNVYGNDWSENGWRMCNRDECVIVAGPHMDTAPLRRGPAEIILGDFVRRYHTQCDAVTSAVWGWSLENAVGDSNHLAATAVDVNAPKWPWGSKIMPAALVTKINNLLAFYEGAVFHGRNWGRPDEMHFQLNWPEGDTRYARIIAKIQGTPTQPVDPNAFPLPAGYFYGPSDWNEDSVSGTYDGELQSWRDGLGRWQSTLGVPATKVWDDATAKAASVLQKAKGWPVTNGIYGTVHEGEWNAVIKEGWRLPGAPPPPPPEKKPVRVGPADDQLTMRFNCLGEQTLVEAVAELRDSVMGTRDKDKTGVVVV